MFARMLLASAVFAAALLALTQVAAAADKTHEGTVVSAAEGKLVMTDKEGKNEHTHTLAATTKVTLDGKTAKISDLHQGDMVKVTTEEDGKVAAIDAKRDNK
jgi:hypothetical protein